MTKGEILIRRGTLDDVGDIAAFNQSMARETEGIELIPEVILAGTKQLTENENLGFYLVAESAGKIIGSLMVTTEWSDWRNGQFWWIQSVYVVPAWRRRGLYRRLYEKVKALAGANENVCGYRLYVEKENTTAQTTYDRVGMHETHYKIYEELKEDVDFMKNSREI